VRKQTENDAISQRVLLNLKTIQKNKKVEEQEKNRLDNNNKPLSAPRSAMSNSQAAYLKP
jgi:hypothetical protein